jgi:hypothetical protein
MTDHRVSQKESCLDLAKLSLWLFLRELTYCANTKYGCLLGTTEDNLFGLITFTKSFCCEYSEGWTSGGLTICLVL